MASHCYQPFVQRAIEYGAQAAEAQPQETPAPQDVTGQQSQE